MWFKPVPPIGSFRKALKWYQSKVSTEQTFCDHKIIHSVLVVDMGSFRGLKEE